MIIGLAGRKGSGKTTLGNALASIYGLEHLSFAAPIRRFVADILGETVESLESRKEAPVEWLDGVTPRHMMQVVGTEFGREAIHPELWVRAALRKASLSTGAVISDVRFPNEARAIRELGGVVIRLNRNTATTTDNHSSEVPLPAALVDHEIDNSGTVEESIGRIKFELACRIGAFRAARCVAGQGIQLGGAA